MNFFVAFRLQTWPSFCLLCDNGVGLENTHLLPAVKLCQQRALEKHWRREGLLSRLLCAFLSRLLKCKWLPRVSMASEAVQQSATGGIFHKWLPLHLLRKLQSRCCRPGTSHEPLPFPPTPLEFWGTTLPSLGQPPPAPQRMVSWWGLLAWQLSWTTSLDTLRAALQLLRTSPPSSEQGGLDLRLGGMALFYISSLWPLLRP